jgi:hypothetical protein
MGRKYLEVELFSAVLMEVVLFLVPLSQVDEEQHHHQMVPLLLLTTMYQAGISVVETFSQISSSLQV